MGTCSRQSAEHQLISEMKARLAIFVLLLFLVYCPASTEGPCCDIQVVSGQGSVDGIYTLTKNPTMAVDEVCLDSCVYTKFGEDDEYCFKGANIPGTTECSVLTTESFTSGTTAVPSAEDLTNEKDALKEDLDKDKEELVSLEAEEEAANAVDAEIDGVEAKIEQLTQTSDETTTDARVKRQAATSCVEVGTIVDEMTRERETAKKLVLIRKITTSTILSCTSEDDKQFLVVAKTTLKEKIKMVKETNSENMTVIRQTILKVKVKIVTKEKKIENILAKLEAIENQTTTSVPTTNQPTTNQPTTKQPTTIQPTTNQQTTNQPTTNWPTTSLPTTKKPTTSQPTTNQ